MPRNDDHSGVNCSKEAGKS